MFYRALYCFLFLRRNFSRNESESLFLLGKKRRKTCVTRKRKSSRLSLLGIHFSVIIFYHLYLYYSYNVYCSTKYRSLTYFKVPLMSLTALTLLMRSLLRVLFTRTIITFFLILLTCTPPLVIAKYTHLILEMLITTDHISVEQTLNSSQSSI